MRTAQPIQQNGEQRAELEQLIRRGKAAARVQTRARILLLSAEGKSEAEITEALHTCIPVLLQCTRFAATFARKECKEPCTISPTLADHLASPEKCKPN